MCMKTTLYEKDNYIVCRIIWRVHLFGAACVITFMGVVAQKGR